MQRDAIRLTLVTAGILLVPLIGMQLSDEWNWTVSDFLFAGTLIFGTGLAYALITKRSANVAYRTAIGLALATAFLLVWVNGAVGLIGDGPANRIYLLVPFIGLVGAIVARLQPLGMSRALFAAAFVMALIPLIALAVGTADFSPGVAPVFVNFFFVILFVGSALLFRRASAKRRTPD